MKLLSSVAIGVAVSLGTLGCAFLMPGDRLMRVTGQIETSEQDCRLRVLKSNGQHHSEHRIDAKFAIGFAVRPSVGRYRAEVVCAGGHLVSRQYELKPQDSNVVDLGSIQLRPAQK